jgi:hypothetical protein
MPDNASAFWEEEFKNGLFSFIYFNHALRQQCGRGIAHAFYTGKIIVAFRLTEALPRRDFLFYLGDTCWLDALNSPPERHVEALTARINRRSTSLQCHRDNRITKHLKLQ